MFIRYLRPAWYFNLGTLPSGHRWADYRECITDVSKKLDCTQVYTHESILAWDCAYQLLLKGFSLTQPCKSLAFFEGQIPVKDEYRFIRRHFNAFWGLYILLIRLISFHNPFIELASFIGSLRIRRTSLYNQVENDFQWTNDVTVRPYFVSVILPTLNRYNYLLQILKDLEAQTYRNFEVIVIDQSKPYQEDFYHQFDLNLRLIRQEERGLWKARNAGVINAQGELIAFTEDDVRISSNWIDQHIRCLHEFDAGISTGVFYPEGTKIPVEKSMFRWAEQFSSGNAMVRKEVFELTGLFDLQFEGMRMGDGEFGVRAYLCGVGSVSNPRAFALDVKAPEGGLREMGSWDSFRPTKWFHPRPVPSVLYYVRSYFGNRSATLDLLLKLPMSVIPFKHKGNPLLIFLSFFIIVFSLPLIIVQVFKSWRISSKMLNTGSRISTLSGAPDSC